MSSTAVFSDEFLGALGAWQRGWRENPQRRQKITTDLLASISASGLPSPALRADQTCYRKRFLVPNNPQNDGDLVPLVIDGRIEEGIASWTTELKYAQDFKDALREANICAVFGHIPKASEVVLNIKTLWTLPDFVRAVDAYGAKGGVNADALQNFKARQSEVILNAPLLYEEVEGFCGRSSPFELLCDLAGLTIESERDSYWRKLVEKGIFPEEPMWLKKDAAQRALASAKDKFLARKNVEK